MDVISEAIKQVKETEYKPTAIFVLMKNRWVDIMKNKRIFRKYFKEISE